MFMLEIVGDLLLSAVGQADHAEERQLRLALAGKIQSELDRT
jgi:hypothetical protein